MHPERTPSVVSRFEQSPEIAAALLAALSEHPLTFDLSEEQRCELVAYTLQEEKVNDAAWLEAAALRLRAGETLMPAQGPASADKAWSLSIPVSQATRVTSNDQLAAILFEHRAWVQKTLEPGKELSAGRANLKGNDLRAYSLAGADLRAANLQGCDLRGVDLTHANLAGADLSHALLAGANLEHARLRRSNLLGADLRDARLVGADLWQAKFDPSQLDLALVAGIASEGLPQDSEIQS